MEYKYNIVYLSTAGVTFVTYYESNLKSGYAIVKSNLNYGSCHSSRYCNQKE